MALAASTDKTDSHDSNSMARPVSSASVDGWDAESSSAEQPSSDELAARLRDEPVKEERAEAKADVDDDLDDTPDRETPPAEGEAPKKKRLTAAERKAVLQAEFNAITRQREDARRAFEAEEREREQKRAARTEPAKPAADKVPDTPAEAAKLEVADGQPDWDQYEEAGKTFSEYQKDLRKFFREEAVREARLAAKSEVTSLLATNREQDLANREAAAEDARRDAAVAKYPDWAEKIAENLSDVEQTPFMTTVVRRHPAGMDLLYQLAENPAEAKILATLPMTRPMMDVVKESPDPAPILLYFARHPEEHDRIAHLDPPRQLLALGRLSATLSPDEGAKTGSPSPAPPVTSAKPPIRPVGATRSTGGSKDDSDDVEFGPEYVRRENERRAALGRR
jgi:hypothetical protein